MPPRVALAALSSLQPAYQPLAPFLYPGLVQQCRAASILSSLSDTKGSYNKRIRVGRGPSSGYGKTSGRGHKGQNQHGKVPAGFNGGQTPDWVVSGKRGEGPNRFAADLSKINLNKIQAWINLNRLDPAAPITLRELADSRCIHGVRPDGVKLLARGKEELTSPINIIVSRASAEAIKAVEAAGGTVTTRYYTKFAVGKIRGGEMDPVNSLQSRINGTTTNEQGKQMGEKMKYRFRLPDPASRKDLEYYRDEAKRGYLSHTVAEGQGPSLFFRKPGQGRQPGDKKRTGGSGKTSGGSESRLW